MAVDPLTGTVISAAAKGLFSSSNTAPAGPAISGSGQGTTVQHGPVFAAQGGLLGADGAPGQPRFGVSVAAPGLPDDTGKQILIGVTVAVLGALAIRYLGGRR